MLPKPTRKGKAWKAKGGYGSQGDGETTNGRTNSGRERIWYSPHCVFERTLFE